MVSPCSFSSSFSFSRSRSFPEKSAPLTQRGVVHFCVQKFLSGLAGLVFLLPTLLDGKP